jgi:hypothetical protein
MNVSVPDTYPGHEADELSSGSESVLTLHRASHAHFPGFEEGLHEVDGPGHELGDQVGPVEGPGWVERCR